MMKNALYIILKAYFVLEIFKILSLHFGHVEKLIYKNGQVNFKLYDVIDWTTNNYNTHIDQYLKK